MALAALALAELRAAQARRAQLAAAGLDDIAAAIGQASAAMSPAAAAAAAFPHPPQTAPPAPGPEDQPISLSWRTCGALRPASRRWTAGQSRSATRRKLSVVFGVAGIDNHGWHLNPMCHSCTRIPGVPKTCRASCLLVWQT